MQSIALTALTAIAGTSISIHFWSASDFSSRPRLTWLIPTGSSVVFSDNYLCHLTWKIQGLGFPWKDVWCNVWYGKHCRQHWWRQTCSLVKWCNMLDVFINCTHTCRQRNNFEIFLCAHVNSWRWLVHTGSFFLQWRVSFHEYPESPSTPHNPLLRYISCVHVWTSFRSFIPSGPLGWKRSQ